MAQTARRTLYGLPGVSLQSDDDLLDQTDEPFLYRNSATYLVTYEQ
jgi:hypothetical protein